MNIMQPTMKFVKIKDIYPKAPKDSLELEVILWKLDRAPHTAKMYLHKGSTYKIFSRDAEEARNSPDKFKEFHAWAIEKGIYSEKERVRMPFYMLNLPKDAIDKFYVH